MMFDGDEELEDMASFMVAFPGWTPKDYWGLTLKERDAIVAAYNKVHKEK